MLPIVNIAAYRFIRLPCEFLHQLHIALKREALLLGLKGSILLSPEGINLFLAGDVSAIDKFKNLLNQFSYFRNLTFKKSFSDFQPFQKMLVKIKKEIIPFGLDNIHPEVYTAPAIKPQTLKKWIGERSDVVLLDTRNDFEIQMGSFKNALNLRIKHFRDFPTAVKKSTVLNKNSTLVTFCTGGIRCEKASAFLLQEGFHQVYQLAGGILNYFEQCRGEHYKGLCFVFDERKALMPSLEVYNAN